jgi:MmyB-like transcription regulator ligand binding domain
MCSRKATQPARIDGLDGAGSAAPHDERRCRARLVRSGHVGGRAGAAARCITSSNARRPARPTSAATATGRRRWIERSRKLDAVREALERILEGHLPYAAVIADRHGDLVSGNAAFWALLDGVASELLEPPVSVHFGTAADVTVSELRLEAFLPEDEATAATLTELVQASRARSST